jgi:hypothetical protein
LLSKNIKIETYRTVSLTVVLDETWCLAVKEEQKLRMLQNRTLRKISESKREEMIGDCIVKSFIVGTPPPNITRVIKQGRMKWVMRAAHEGEKRNGYRVQVERDKGRRPFRRPR